MSEKKGLRFNRLFGVLLCFVGLSLFLLLERSGIQHVTSAYKDPYLTAGQDYNWKEAGSDKTCLMIVQSESDTSRNGQLHMNQILTDMRVAYNTLDLSSSVLPDLSSYETVIVLVSNLDTFGEAILDLCEWVKQGGQVMFALPFQKTQMFDLISSKLGIIESSYENAVVRSILPAKGFMVGGNRAFPIIDSYHAALTVRTGENCEVFAKEANNQTPLIWSTPYGNGKFVIDNLAYMEKAYRGFYAASYSLLDSTCLYPVINGSSFYIDDFLSPVPSGEGAYIKRDYQMSVSDFYTSVWWPDMIRLAKKHNMVYTGMIIENYKKQTSGDLPRNQERSRYQFFGNMLLNLGGELGFHGYNHQPLCLDNFNYVENLGYNTWDSPEEMRKSIQELDEFSSGTFPEARFSVYVPPSNILSAEGRKMLADEFPDIRTIASTYLSGGSSYEQEFEVAADGMIETPRIVSGYEINDYMVVAALSELNLHFVNSHVLHPDDLLNEEQGAKMGWHTLKERFSSSLTWLYESAPAIRNLTGSEMGGAVERYCALSLWKHDTPDTLYITVDGLQDEAYLMLRVNDGKVGAVKGGSLTPLTGNLYLLHVQEPEIEIERIR